MKGKTSGHPGRTVLRVLALCLCAFLFIQPAMAAEWDMSFFEYANTQMAGLEYPNFYFTLSGREKQKYDDGKLHLKNAEISDVVFEPDPYSAGSFRAFARAYFPSAGTVEIGSTQYRALRQTKIPEELVGVWEYPAVTGNPWTDRLTFCEDGTFIYLQYPKRLGQASVTLRVGRFGYSNGYIMTSLNDRFVFDGKKLYRYYKEKLTAVKRTSKKAKNMKSLKLTRFYPDQPNGDAILAGLGYRQPGEYRPEGFPVALTFKPDFPLNAALNFHISDPEVLEVLGYSYGNVFLRGKKAGTAQIYAEAADGTGVKSNTVEIRVLEGEASLPEEILNKRWDFVSDSYTWKSHLVFNATGQYYYFCENGSDLTCECGSYRYLDGMIQTDARYNKLLFIEEIDGQTCLRSAHGSGKENYLNTNASQGVFYPAELLTGRQSLGDLTYMFDKNGIPYDSNQAVDWARHKSFTVEPVK